MTVRITCEDCGRQLEAEPRRTSFGGPPMAITIPCPCGTRWQALVESGTSWREPPMAGASPGDDAA